MRKHSGRSQLQAGLTMVEIMVAMLLSIILLGGMIQIFISSKTTYNMQESLSRMQENGRFALNFLVKDLRRAGYLGCVSDIDLTHVLNTLDTDDPAYSNDFGFYAQGIAGWEYAGTGNGTTYSFAADASPVDMSTDASWSSSSTVPKASISVLPGTDVVRLWGGGSDPVSVNSVSGSSGSGSAQTVVRTTLTDNFQDDDIVMLTDCARAMVGQACNVGTSTSGGTTQTQLTFSEGCSPGNDVPASTGLNIPPGEAVTLTSSMYFVGRAGPDQPPALYRADMLATGPGVMQPLVPGIESLQFTYGVDADNNGAAEVYQTADAVTDWTRVVSVRVALLAASVEPGLTEDNTQTYNLLGTTIDPPDDRQMRQVFISTVTLRNRAL